MEPTALTSGKNADNNSSFQTDSITPTPGALVLIFVASAPSLPVTPATPTISGNSLPWRMDQTILGGAGNDRRLTCFTAMGPTPTAGRINIDFADEVQDLIQWSVMEFTGVNTAGAAGVGAVAQRISGAGSGAGVSLTLDPLADTARNATVGAVMLDITVTDPDRPVTPGAGFTEVHDVTDRQFLGRGASLQTQAAGTGRTTVNWTWNGAENSAAIALEVKAKPLPESGGGVLPTDRNEALIKRFEPVLFLHPQEAFVPSDAKRYIENAALWSAKGPFDDKNLWTPLVKATELVAAQSELTPTKRYLGEPGLLTATANDVRFLELGGWKDKNANHEAGVTDSTTNRYADRADIATRYRGALEASRFWYHAEVYEHSRLVGLADDVEAPNLSRIVAKYPDALLLCYYFFFPAHEQSVGLEACSNVEAKELACHAGDWQCIALLLTGDGSGSATGYTPEFFGYSGLRPKDADTSVRYSGDADLGGYTVMTIEPWRSGSAAGGIAPELVGDHPCFYVARGSHSLYTTAGFHEVDPEVNSSQASVSCGRLDTPNPIPPDEGTTDQYLLEALAVLFLKMLAGGLFGNVFAGIVAADVEAIIPEPFEPTPGQHHDAPNPDSTPTVATAMTIKPVGVTVPNTGAQVHDWRVQKSLSIGGRTYDYVVDRTRQIWWPSDDLRSGYRGRWGQHVAADPMDRRNGPQFLQFWKMFLTAMAGLDR